MRKSLLLTVFFCVILGLTPYAALFVMHGGPYQVPPEFMDDSNYYYARMQEVVSGHPFIGNPYLKEHADEVASAFFGADWVASVPLFLTNELMPAVLLNVVIWSAIFSALLYWLFGLIGLYGRMRVLAVFSTFLASFWFMERPVAMQIVYPVFVFLLGSVFLWLKHPESRRAQLLLVASAGLSFYLYTYLWQITVVVGALLNAWILLRNRYNFRTLVGIDIGIVLVALPMGLYMIKQLSHPWYWESVRRIGYVATHTFGMSGVMAALTLLAAGVALVCVRKHLDTSTRLFFGITGTALLITTFSNVLSGKDLETAVHIGRFVDLWAVFSAIVAISYALPEVRKSTPRIHVALILSGILLAHSIVPVVVQASRLSSELLAYERYAPVLSWIEENIEPGSVILADDKLSYYIPALTDAYVLFHPNAGLYLVPDTEMQERYLLSRSFGTLTEENIRQDLRLYAGVGNAVHAHKTHNREVRICSLLWKQRCADTADAEALLPQDYFANMSKRSKLIKEERERKLTEYNVSYVIRDRVRNTNFNPEQIDGAVRIFSNTDFEIFKHTQY